MIIIGSGLTFFNYIMEKQKINTFLEELEPIVKNWIRDVLAEYMIKKRQAPKNTIYEKKDVFHNDVILQEFERVFNIVSEWEDGFNVSGFLSVYNDETNPLRFEKYFYHKNAKTYIDTYIRFKNLALEYKQRTRKWVKKDIHNVEDNFNF